MTASTLLKKQHREVEKLFSTALKTDNPKTRKQKRFGDGRSAELAEQMAGRKAA